MKTISKFYDGKKIAYKTLYFEVILSLLLDWYRQVSGKNTNDLSISKATRLLFFVASCNTRPNKKSYLIEDVFDNFNATPFGHTESDVLKSIFKGNLRFFEINNRYTTRKASLNEIISKIRDRNKDIIIDEIFESFDYLKKRNNNLITYTGSDLIEISQDHFSYKKYYVRGEMRKINPEVIKNEMKFFYRQDIWF